jgi:hypothetical protein
MGALALAIAAQANALPPAPVAPPAPPLSPEMKTKDKFDYECAITGQDVRSGSLVFSLDGHRGYPASIDASGRTFAQSTPRTFVKKKDTLNLLNGLVFKGTSEDTFSMSGIIWLNFKDGRNRNFRIDLIENREEREYDLTKSVSVRAGYASLNTMPKAVGYCREIRTPQKPLSSAEIAQVLGK